MSGSGITEGSSPRFFDGVRLKQILVLALPIIGGMVSQNVLNIVDTLMVSQLGPAALAAVGLGGFTNFLCVAFITGLAAGVQAMAARRKGEGREDETAVPLNGGLLMVLTIGLPLSAILILAAPILFPLLNGDPEVLEHGVPYLQARLFAIVAVGANFAFRGYWNGIGRSSVYMFTLVCMHLCNVALSYCLIFGKLGLPELGALGAGIGTAASTFFGTALYISLSLKYARGGGFLRGVPSWETMKSMIRISVPSGVQQVFFAAGLTAFFIIVGRVGTAELAAASVLVNITLVALLPGLGFGLASASLVGQALGRGDKADAKRWGWDVIKAAALVMGLLGVPMLVAPGALLDPFFDLSLADEIAAYQLALWPLRLVGATILFDAVGMVLLNSLIGAGDTRTAMVVSVVFQWGLFLPAAYVVGPLLGGGLMAIWIAQVGYRSLQGLALAILWKAGRWGETAV